MQAFSLLFAVSFLLPWMEAQECGDVTNFTLVNAQTHQDLGILPTIINLQSYAPNATFNIRANVAQCPDKQTRSVLVKYASTADTDRVFCEEWPPFSVWGDFNATGVDVVDFKKANYTRHLFPNKTADAFVLAIPFFEDGCKGLRGAALRKNFKIVASDKDGEATCMVGSVTSFEIRTGKGKFVASVSQSKELCIPNGADWYIRALTKPCPNSTIASVRLTHKSHGDAQYVATLDSRTPYQIPLPIPPKRIVVHVTATPYSSSGARGVPGPVKMVSFPISICPVTDLVPGSCAVTRIQYEGQTISDGEKICQTKPSVPPIEVIVECTGQISPSMVIFKMSGKETVASKVMGSGPYRLGGSQGAKLSKGAYQLSATPYFGNSSKGTTMTIGFDIVSCASAAPRTVSPVATVQTYMPIISPTIAPAYVPISSPTSAPGTSSAVTEQPTEGSTAVQTCETVEAAYDACMDANISQEEYHTCMICVINSISDFPRNCNALQRKFCPKYQVCAASCGVCSEIVEQYAGCAVGLTDCILNCS